MSKSGTAGSWSNGAFTVRYRWSSVYNSTTKKSTVTIVPQIYNTVIWGGDLYACGYALGDAGGVYINGSIAYQFDGNWGYPENLQCAANVNEWTDFPPRSGSIDSFVVTHDSTGRASFTLGFYGTIVPQYSEGTRTTVGNNIASSFVTVTIAEDLTVSYNANGHGTAPASQTATYNTNISLRSFISNQTGATSAYLVTGDVNGGTWGSSGSHNGSATKTPQYTQTYWNTASDGSGTNYNAKASYTVTSDRTMYAKWSTSYAYTYTVPANTPSKTSTNQITISFNANGGSTTKTSQNSSRTTTYNFLGWYTAATGGTKRTSDSQISAAETVYAHYEANTPGAYSTVTLPTASQCTRTGYTLLGFSLSSTATTASRAPGETYSPNSYYTTGYTWYAVWAINSYSVTYNANGHGTAPTSQSGNYNSTITLKTFIGNQSATGTKSSYTITGNANGGTWSGSNGTATKTPNFTYKQTEWNTASGGGGTSYASKASYTIPANNRTLYAIWSTSTSYSYTYAVPSGTPTKNQSVTVSFDADGGGSPASKTSTRKMAFDGWYTAATGGTKRTGSSQVSQSETVYAHYSDGTSAYPAITLPTVSKTGYTFSGWYTASVGGTRVGGAGSSYVPTATTTLYAHWAVIEYKLTTSTSASGITLTVNRTSSPISGSTGSIVSGATLYTGDVLAISYTLGAGKQIDTATVNGQSFTDSVNVTVTGNVSVIATVKSSAVVKIYHDGAWQDYQIYIYSNGQWSQYQAYICDGANWIPY